MPTLVSREAHRQAGLCSTFMWQDDAAEGRGDPASVDSTSIIGTLPQEVNGAPVYLVHVQGTADSGFGYDYPVEQTVTVQLQANGEPMVGIATDEEIAQAEQYGRDEACKEYGELMRSGADQKRVSELNEAALEQGMHFALTQNGEGYVLEPATQEELAAYEQAKEEAEDEEDQA